MTKASGPLDFREPRQRARRFPQMTLRRATSVASPLRMTRNTTARRGGGANRQGDKFRTHTHARAVQHRDATSVRPRKGRTHFPRCIRLMKGPPPLPPRRELTCPSSSSLLVLTMTTSEKREGGTQTHGGVLFFFRLSLSLSLSYTGRISGTSGSCLAQRLERETRRPPIRKQNLLISFRLPD